MWTDFSAHELAQLCLFLLTVQLLYIDPFVGDVEVDIVWVIALLLTINAFAILHVRIVGIDHVADHPNQNSFAYWRAVEARVSRRIPALRRNGGLAKAPPPVVPTQNPGELVQ